MTIQARCHRELVDLALLYIEFTKKEWPLLAKGYSGLPLVALNRKYNAEFCATNQCTMKQVLKGIRLAKELE